MTAEEIPTTWNGYDYLQHSYTELKELLALAREEEEDQLTRLAQMSQDNLKAWASLPYHKVNVIHSAMLTKLRNREFF